MMRGRRVPTRTRRFMAPSESTRDPSRVWQRTRDGLPTIVLGRLPEPPAGLEVVRVRCDEGEPLVEARRRALALLGEAEPEGKKPARRRKPSDREVEGLIDAWGRLADGRGIIFEEVGAAEAATLAMLVRVLELRGEQRLPLVLAVGEGEGAEELVAAVRRRAGAEAVVRIDPPPAWRSLPIEVVRVLRAAGFVGPGFAAAEVAGLLRCDVLAVLEGLQAAADLGVAIEDHGGRFVLPAELVVELGASLLPSLAEGWRGRLVALRSWGAEAERVSEGTGGSRVAVLGGAEVREEVAVEEVAVVVRAPAVEPDGPAAVSPVAAEVEAGWDELAETVREPVIAEARVEATQAHGAEGLAEGAGAARVPEAGVGLSERAGAGAEAVSDGLSEGTGDAGEPEAPAGAAVEGLSEGTGDASEPEAPAGAAVDDLAEETGEVVVPAVTLPASEAELEDGDLEEVDDAAWKSGSMFARGQPKARGGVQPPRLRPKPPKLASLSVAAARGEARMPTRNPSLDVAARLRSVPVPMPEPPLAGAQEGASLQEAGDVDAAAARFCQAAHEAAESGNPKVAVEHVQRALGLLQGPPSTPERRRLRGLALLELGQLQWQSAGPDLGFTLPQALRTLESAGAEFGTTASTELAVQLCQAIAGVCFEIGDMRSLERALQELVAASRMLHADGDAYAAARLLNDQAAVLVRMGDPVQALQLLKESRKVFQERSADDPVALRELAETDHLFARLPLHAEMRPGRALEGYRMGLAHAQKAERAYRQLGDARELGRVWETMGRLELKMEQLETATKHLEAAADVQMQLGDLTGLARTTEALSEALGLRGRDGEAIELLRDSIQFNRSKGSPLGLTVNRRVYAALAERLAAHPLYAPALREVGLLLDAGERELGETTAE